MLHTDSLNGKPGDGPEPAAPTSASAVLLIAPPDRAAPIRRLLDAAGPPSVRIAVAEDMDGARPLLEGQSFDAILLDLSTISGAEPEVLRALRKMAGTAALVVRGGAGGVDQDVDPAAGVHARLEQGDSPAAAAACIRTSLYTRRIGLDLALRSAELAESEARFHNIVERTPDGIVIVGQDGRVRFANPGAERMFARSEAELIGEDFGVAVVSGETTEMDIVRPSRDEPVITELRVSGTTWEGSAAQVISLRDITDRKRAEERAQRLLLAHAAREQAEKDAEHSRILADAGATLDASLKAHSTLTNVATLVVPRIADWCLVDLLEEDDVVRRVAAVHSDPEKQPLLEELGERFPGRLDSPTPIGKVLRSRSAELHTELDEAGIRELAGSDEHAELLARLGLRSVITVPLEAREKCLGAMTFVRAELDFDEADLTFAWEIASRAARALENARLFEAAVDADRVKSDFLAVMSHELRTPLTAILGYTDLLLEGVAGSVDDKQVKYLGRIRVGATQLLTIIQEILTYAQAEAGLEQARPGTIQIGELIDEIVTTAEPLTREKGLDFRIQVAQRETILHTDVGKVRQIVLSLLTNATKFTDSGSIELTAAIQEDELSIAISDTGIGIEERELEGIFEAFKQIEQGPTRRAGGTGLGLSISRQLAGILGGTLSVESEPGKGSTFTLRVPAGTPDKAAKKG